MAEAVYFLCAVSSFLCAILLLRAYRKTHYPLLRWSGWCFVGLALNNLFLVADLVFAPGGDLAVWRNLSGLAGCCFLIYGLLWTRVDTLTPGTE